MLLHPCDKNKQTQDGVGAGSERVSLGDDPYSDYLEFGHCDSLNLMQYPTPVDASAAARASRGLAPPRFAAQEPNQPAALPNDRLNGSGGSNNCSTSGGAGGGDAGGCSNGGGGDGSVSSNGGGSHSHVDMGEGDAVSALGSDLGGGSAAAMEVYNMFGLTLPNMACDPYYDCSSVYSSQH